MLVCLPPPLGWLQSEVHLSDQPDQGDRTGAISTLLQSSRQHLQDPQKWSRSSSADRVCTINTMLNVQTELECRQHAAANAIMVSQELSGALLKAAVGLVFPPSTHLILKKQLYGRLTILLLKSVAETWVSLGSLLQEANQS